MKLITAPTTEPISLTEAKAHLRIAHTDQDTMITALIKAARFQFESDVPEIQLISSVWALYFDNMPCYNARRGANIIIKKYPLIKTTVPVIKYYTPGTADLVTLETTNYEIDFDNYPGRIRFTESIDIDTEKYNCLQVQFNAGYADAASVPFDIKQALLLLIAHFYENPSQHISGTITSEFKQGYDSIIRNYKLEII